jgi:thioredoxin reductase/pSer/pThr/pTyr-binding forkhead associated (FHA) protein/ferredoxin
MAGAADSDYTTFGTLKVTEPRALPDLLDVFVAGGGPAGTAAAVRAKEYGLSALVVDYDDLMKRIRDYPKEKLIKPGYGGGDKMQFPPGGPMLESLYFDDVDKDELVARWKTRYKEFSIVAKIGSEFTGLARLDDGIWEIKTWNHRAGKEVRYRARNVIIAIGAGVPRRFDIPGNTDGLAFRLVDAANYVGAPTLVIGGGTSAAEAVIAISHAKVKAEDTTAVYWSYRGDRMPKVSKALSEVFFDAYVGNGNIRYLAFSEPVAVVTAPDKSDYLSVRIDRKTIEGRPPETVHLEFAKSHVVACIGEDLPVKLLQGCGVKVPLLNDRPLMLVNRDGEVSLPGVFLAGDARGPRYLRCTDFNDSTTYEQVVQKRNIKAAMVEAVEAIEVIASRSGKAAAKIARPAAAAATSVVPPVPSEPSESRPEKPATQLVSLHPDGTVDEHFPITKDLLSVGRGATDISCPDDVYMADSHATLTKRDGGYVLADTGQGSGVWIRVQGVQGRALGEGDTVWVGAQILMATKQSGRWALAHYDSDGAYQATYPVGDRGTFVGRASDVPLAPSDMSLSRRHAQFRVEDGVLRVFDLGSKNGTYVKISAPLALANGDEFRIASKRFRYETFAPVAKLAPSDVVAEAGPRPEPVLVAEPTPSAPQPAAIAEGASAAIIEHPEFPVTFGVPFDKDVLHAYFESLKTRFPDCKLSRTGEPAEHMDEPLGWECKVGLCGLCAVQIVDGADNFASVDPGSPELNTLANKAFLDPDPKKYRLACLAKIKGPVKLTIPG